MAFDTTISRRVFGDGGEEFKGIPYCDVTCESTLRISTELNLPVASPSSRFPVCPCFTEHIVQGPPVLVRDHGG